MGTHEGDIEPTKWHVSLIEHCVYLQTSARGKMIIQWIGLGEILQEKPIFNGKTMVSCEFSLKPIHWIIRVHKSSTIWVLSISDKNRMSQMSQRFDQNVSCLYIAKWDLDGQSQILPLSLLMGHENGRMNRFSMRTE